MILIAKIVIAFCALVMCWCIFLYTDNQKKFDREEMRRQREYH